MKGEKVMAWSQEEIQHLAKAKQLGWL